jgi:hypothetical protein
MILTVEHSKDISCCLSDVRVDEHHLSGAVLELEAASAFGFDSPTPPVTESTPSAKTTTTVTRMISVMRAAKNLFM